MFKENKPTEAMKKCRVNHSLLLLQMAKVQNLILSVGHFANSQLDK